MLLLLALACTSPQTPSIPDSPTPDPDLQPTEVTRTYEVSIGYGAWLLKDPEGDTLGNVTGYFADGHFGLPLLVADVGDTVVVKLTNQTATPIGVHPGGLVYDGDNTGYARHVAPGETGTYTWRATHGAGTFPWYATSQDKQRRHVQALKGLLGAVHIRGTLERQNPPDTYINYLFSSSYPAATAYGTEPVHDIPMDTACPECTDTAFIDSHDHNIMVVPQVSTFDEVTGLATTVTETDRTVTVPVDSQVRVNAVGFGEYWYSFHMDNQAWLGPFGVRDTEMLSPGQGLDLPLNPPQSIGRFAVRSQREGHAELTTTWLEVTPPAGP